MSELSTPKRNSPYFLASGTRIILKSLFGKGDKVDIFFAIPPVAQYFTEINEAIKAKELSLMGFPIPALLGLACIPAAGLNCLKSVVGLSGIGIDFKTPNEYSSK